MRDFSIFRQFIYLLLHISKSPCPYILSHFLKKQQSGTGKTVMVEHLYEPLRKKNGGLISIKFQELGQKLPLSLIFEALDQYCFDLLESSLTFIEVQSAQVRFRFAGRQEILRHQARNVLTVQICFPLPHHMHYLISLNTGKFREGTREWTRVTRTTWTNLSAKSIAV